MLSMCLAVIEGEEKRALFIEFYHRYELRLYSVAKNILKNNALAEEATQEAFMRIAKHFEKFLEIFQKDCREIGPWAVTIVKNISLDMLRKERRSEGLPENWDAPAPEDTEKADGYRRLVELIRSMPESYRRALELRFVCEYSTKEVARELGLSPEAAQKRIDRGRALLIEKLKEEGYDHV